MVVSNEVKEIISLLSNGMIWLYIGIFFLISYLIISLFTWSFVKSLKYLGISTVVVGIFLMVIRFSSNLIINLVGSSELSVIGLIMPNLLKPILINGIICVFVGTIMIVGYSLINKKIKEID